MIFNVEYVEFGQILLRLGMLGWGLGPLYSAVLLGTAQHPDRGVVT